MPAKATVATVRTGFTSQYEIIGMHVFNILYKGKNTLPSTRN
jgi:hypothetical protein